MAVQSVPLQLFNMPNLIDLSLFRMALSYHTLLQYNLPSNIDINDSAKTDEWFNENFVWNNQTTYWLNNDLCAESNNSVSIPYALEQFLMSDNIRCQTPCQGMSSALCYPRNWGDGKCDIFCNIDECNYDGGDCAQLCFSELTNCSYTLEYNDCYETSKYCKDYLSIDVFTELTADQIDEYDDFNDSQCAVSSEQSEYWQTPSDSQMSIVTFVFAQLDSTVDYHCNASYISDGLCEDMCRTEECAQDGGDCDLQCTDDWCSDAFLIWTYFAGQDNNIPAGKFCDEWSTWWLGDRSLDVMLGEFFYGIDTQTSCQFLTQLADLNSDGYFNFREVTAISSMTRMDHLDAAKLMGANCSFCMQMKDYNAMYQPV